MDPMTKMMKPHWMNPKKLSKKKKFWIALHGNLCFTSQQTQGARSIRFHSTLLSTMVIWWYNVIKNQNFFHLFRHSNGNIRKLPNFEFGLIVRLALRASVRMRVWCPRSLLTVQTIASIKMQNKNLIKTTKCRSISFSMLYFCRIFIAFNLKLIRRVIYFILIQIEANQKRGWICRLSTQNKWNWIELNRTECRMIIHSLIDK